ncbi:MAG: NlpC/P60 family protein [Clostridia bacterium]|nr:NlpC/P60 family protein [Clostridia bacterium]
MSEDNQMKDINQVLEQYKGVPFLHNGRNLKGMDCLGFVVHFYRNFGLSLPDHDGNVISKDWYVKDPQRYIRSLSKLNAVQVSLDDLQALDLVYFSISRGIITHTGVMINDKQFAHMSPKSNCMVSKMERHWLARCRGAIRFLELDSRFN